MKILSHSEQTELLIFNTSKFLNITLSDIDDDEKELLRADLRVLLYIGTNFQEQFVEDYIDELKESVLRTCK
ncbi:hypothetical protein ACSGOQ_005476 [Escherichia coli]|uniref:hypothetical protein n=1 Tax=Escherichia coli TaxID=562 RepID=UPI001A466BFB|nr:hypothetical protein [Escherichia coli]ELW0836536.1 hypothetical protein [Escherichia coli]WGM49316.1 hypothetical protein EcMJ_074 [Escherichia phage vB_Ec-M-J]VVY12277.1 Uncharacterised protein [Escherichia coli]